MLYTNTIKMMINAKYLILFPALTFATVSLENGKEMIIDSGTYFSCGSQMDFAPKRYSFCSQGSTAVYIFQPVEINEQEIKNEIAYQEKLNSLSQTVNKFLKIKLKKRKHK
jgi:hypothetical protein